MPSRPHYDRSDAYAKGQGLFITSPAQAREYYQQLLTQNPQNLLVLKMLGLSALRENNYELAIQYFNNALLLDNSPELISLKASALYRANRFVEAVSCYQLLEKNDPNHAHCLEIINPLKSMGQMNAIREWFDRAIEMCQATTSENTLKLLTLLHRKTQFLCSELQAFQEVVQTTELFLQAMMRLKAQLANLSNDQSFSLQMIHIDILRTKALALFHLGNFDGAIQYSKKSTQLNSRINDDEPYFQSQLIGLAYLCKKQADEAMTKFDKILSIAKNNAATIVIADSLSLKGLCLLIKKDLKAAEEACLKSLDIDPKNLFAQIGIYGLSQISGRTSCSDQLDNAIRSVGTLEEKLRIFMIEGIVYQAIGLDLDAKLAFDNALQLKSDYEQSKTHIQQLPSDEEIAETQLKREDAKLKTALLSRLKALEQQASFMQIPEIKARFAELEPQALQLHCVEFFLSRAAFYESIARKVDKLEIKFGLYRPALLDYRTAVEFDPGIRFAREKVEAIQAVLRHQTTLHNQLSVAKKSFFAKPAQAQSLTRNDLTPTELQLLEKIKSSVLNP